MTETRTPPQGQIESPNPVELLWEKHRRTILAIAVVALVALGLNYGIQYKNEREVSSLWSRVAAATNLDAGYTEDGSLASMLQNAQGQTAFQWAQYYLQSAHAELVTDLQRDLAAAEPNALQNALTEAAGTGAEPVLLWAAAVHYAQKAEWDAALGALDQLEKRFPDHFLTLATPYPVQFREPLEDESEKEQAETPPPRRGRDKPKLEEPVAGSPVGLLRGQIERARTFREQHSELYAPPEPAEKPEVVLKLSNDEQIRIRFYPDRAPEHVRNFLELAKTDFYQNQAIDEVVRAAQGGFMAEDTPCMLHFGLGEAAKDADITKWRDARSKPSERVLAFEDSNLSHFPGMVAAAPEGEGKSSGERVWINATDAARYDGERVVFGRVVGPESFEALERICRAEFRDLDMQRMGRGQLQTDVRIKEIEVLE